MLAVLALPATLFAQSRDFHVQGIVVDDGNGNTITIQAPVGGTSYTLTLPTMLPTGNYLLTMDSTGAMVASSPSTAIVDNAITPSKINTTGASTGDVLTFDGSDAVWAASSGGSVADSSITDAKVAANAAIDVSKLYLTNGIQNSHLVANSVTTSKVANGTVTTSKMADSAISGLKLLTYAVTSRHIADGAVTTAKIDPTGASSGNVLTYNGSSVVWAAGGSVADSTITDAKVAANAAINVSKLYLTNGIQNGHLMANSVTTSKVANGTVTTSKMADSAISGLKLLTYAVTNRHIADGAVTNAKISGSGATNGYVLMYNSGTNTVGWSNPSVGLSFNRVAISNINSPYTVAAGVDIVGVDITSGPVTVTLPAANSVPAGKILIVKNELGNAVTNNITISRSGTDLINAASTSVTIATGTATGSYNFYSDGVSRWHQY
jgi:hypothetical protein